MEIYRTMYMKLLLIFIILIPSYAGAQVSIVNALPNINNKNGINGGSSLSVSWRNDNNKDTEFIINGGLSISYKERPWLIHFVSKGTYEFENENNIERSIMEHFRLRFSVGDIISPIAALVSITNKKKVNRFNWYDAIYLETFLQHEYDKFRALNARFLWGFGPTIKLVSINNIYVMFGTAYMLEYIDFIRYTDNELNNRWSNYIQSNMELTDNTFIDVVSFIQFKIDNFKDHLLMSTIDLRLMANDWAGVKFGAGIEYDSRPPPNIKNIGTNIRTEFFIEL